MTAESDLAPNGGARSAERTHRPVDGPPAAGEGPARARPGRTAAPVPPRGARATSTLFPGPPHRERTFITFPPCMAMPEIPENSSVAGGRKSGSARTGKPGIARFPAFSSFLFAARRVSPGMHSSRGRHLILRTGDGPAPARGTPCSRRRTGRPAMPYRHFLITGYPDNSAYSTPISGR